MNKQPDDEKLWEEFRKYFEAFVVSDIEKSLSAGIEVGVIILTAIGIDCLSGYYAGKKTDRKLFVKFMEDFMPSYATYADDIYGCVRNGLAHDYVIKRNAKTGHTFVFSHDKGEPHLASTTKNSSVIYLNRETFARDFLKAQRKYFDKAESNQKVWDAAIRRLKKRGFLTVRPEDELVTRRK